MKTEFRRCNRKRQSNVCVQHREIAYEFYKNIIDLRPEWNEIKAAEEGAELTDKDKRELKPIERIKMIATRGQDDERNV
jgi:type I restriction enzyme R subunit